MNSLVISSLVIGWLVGGLANWAADILPYINRKPPTATDGESSRYAVLWQHPLRYWWWPGRRTIAAISTTTESATEGVEAPPTASLSGGEPGGEPDDAPIESRPYIPSPPSPWRTPLLLIGMALCYAYTTARLLPAMPAGDLVWQLRQFGPLLLAWLYVAFFLVVLVIDLEHRRVLNIMLLPAVIVALVGSFLPGTPTPISALLGGAVGFGLFVVVYIVGRGRLGAGDVKLAGVIGVMVGHPAVWTALLVGMLLGGMAAIILITSRSATLRSTMAYAPYLAVGAILALWQTWGQGWGGTLIL